MNCPIAAGKKVALATPVFKGDGFVKSPSAVRHAHGLEQSRKAALRFILLHCNVLLCTPHSSGFAGLASGSFFFAV
jgi:hypothetical protein